MAQGDASGAAAHVIDVRALSKRFGPVSALNELSFRVPRGSVYGYLGPNGAGKTTTIRILLGLLRPDAGSATLLGEEAAPGADVIERVGALVERPAFYPYLSARENLLVFAAARGVDRQRGRHLADRALERTDLASVARRRVGGFSTGMKQRLGIALALLDDPQLVILDEPTTGLDPAGMIDVRRMLAALPDGGTTVFLSTHLLAEAEQICTDVAVIDHGHLAASGTTADLFASRQHVRARFRDATDRDAGIGILRSGGIEADADGAADAVLPLEADGSHAIERLASASVYPLEVSIRRPSLESLYVELTETHEELEAG